MEGEQTRATGIKAVAIEAGIVLLLGVLVVGVLSYLKIINLGIFTQKTPDEISKQLSSNKNRSNQNVVPQVQENEQSQDPAYTNYKGNPVQPRLELSTYSSSVVKVAYIVTEVLGKVTEVNASSGFDEDLGLPYNMRLNIDTGSQSAGLVLLYPKEAQDKVKVLDKDNKEIEFSDINVGDTVSVITNTGIYRKYPNNINRVVITKK